jgi:integrase
MEKVNSGLPVVESVYWHWTPNKAGLCPVKLRLAWGEDSRRIYPILVNGKKLFLTQAAYDELTSDKSLRGERKQLRDDIANYLSAAREAIKRATKNNRPFTPERFETEFFVGNADTGFLALFKRNVDTLRADGRLGTSTAYNTAYNVFKAYRKDKELSAHDITPTLLKDFEKYLERGGHQERRKKEGQKNLKVTGVNKTSIGIYMRALKAAYNLAADQDKTLIESYPFARRQNERTTYKIKTGSGHKGDALTIEQLRKLNSLTLDETYSEHEEARLLWLFSFHAQGMNIKDIALLKYKDIDGTTIRYVRHKTKDTESKEAVMEIPVSDELRRIISKIGNPDKRPTSYVFPIIPNGLASEFPRRSDKPRTAEERIVTIIQQKTKMVNKRLSQIAENENAKLKPNEGVKLPAITTYWARHTYANLLRESGHSIELIKDALGHADAKTTRNYVRRFDNDKMKKANEGIMSLLKTGTDK